MKKIIINNNKQFFIWAENALTGEDLTSHQNVLIEIQDKKIRLIDTVLKEKIPSEIKDNPNFYFLENITILPAFIDAHVHLGIAKTLPSQYLEIDKNIFQKEVQKELTGFLKSGIFAVRDGGDLHKINTEIREMIKNDCLEGPIIVATGEAVRKKSYYGSFLGRGYRGRDDLKLLIDRIVGTGVDQLKVVVSGIVSFKKYGIVEPSGITFEELLYVVNRARDKGIKVMAHASSAEAVNMAIDAGVDSIEHGYFIKKESFAKMASKNIAWIPTILPVSIQVSDKLSFGKTPEEISVITRIYEEHLQKVPLAIEKGVRLGLGTDSGASGVKHGENFTDEMFLYKRAGLSVRKILNSAIYENADLLSLKEKTGCISKNRPPCLIGVKGDPFIDLKVLNKAEWLFMPE